MRYYSGLLVRYDAGPSVATLLRYVVLVILIGIEGLNSLATDHTKHGLVTRIIGTD